MNIEEVRVYGLGLPQATERCPFGPDTLSLEIGGRMFCLMTLDGEWDFFNLKVDPDYSLQLQERYRSIRSGYHQNKKHWISVDYYGDVPDTLQRELIFHSYCQAARKLPKKEQQCLGITELINTKLNGE